MASAEKDLIGGDNDFRISDAEIRVGSDAADSATSGCGRLVRDEDSDTADVEIANLWLRDNFRISDAEILLPI